MFRFDCFSNDKLLGNEPCVNRLIVVVRAIVPASYKPRPFRVVVIDIINKATIEFWNEKAPALQRKEWIEEIYDKLSNSNFHGMFSES